MRERAINREGGVREREWDIDRKIVRERERKREGERQKKERER